MTAAPTPIEVFADVLCPFAYAGLVRFAQQRDALGRPDLHLWVRAWPLEVVNGQVPDAALLTDEIAALRATVTPTLFAGFDPATFPTTSRPAFAVAAAAYRAGLAVGEAVSFRLRELLWEQGENIADPAVLATVAATHGLTVTEDDQASVERDHAEGAARGAVGSPHFFVGEHGYFCPGLSISHDDAGFHVAADPARFDAFVAAVTA